MKSWILKITTRICNSCWRLTGQSLLILFLLLYACSASEKTSTDSELNQAQMKLLDRADADRRIGLCAEANETYQRILNKTESSRAYIGLGLCAQQNNDIPSQHAYFKKALSLDPDNTALLYQTAETAMKLTKYGEAREMLDKYISLNTEAGKSTKKGEVILERLDFIQNEGKSYEDIKLEPLGPEINTNNLEYLPSIDVQEQQMVFTRRTAGQEDLFVSTKNAQGEWQSAEPIRSINTRANESGHCISADGKTILLTKCDQSITLGSCDIFITRKLESDWTVAINMDAPINTQSWEGQPTLSAQGEYMIFSSTRPGGYGGKDLWISQRSEEGKWSIPKNLGPPINTANHEETPFLHPDENTLYFRSDGPRGYGGYDLYLSRLSKEGWSEPENLGRPINTPGDEGSLVVDVSGKKAYYATEVKKEEAVNARGDIDIYSFVMPEEIRPHPVSFVLFKVIDAETEAPISAEISLKKYSDQKPFYQRQSQGETMVCLPLGDDYAVTVEAESYLFYTDRFELTDVNLEYDPKIVTIRLTKSQSTPKDTPIVLRNVEFESNSAELKNISYTDLRPLHLYLQKNPVASLEVHGHTDNVGRKEDNLKLSLKRAESVKQFLIQEGISEERITTKGFGEQEPIASNENEAGRRKNRRVEIIITTD